MFTIINDWWHIKVWLIFKKRKNEKNKFQIKSKK